MTEENHTIEPQTPEKEAQASADAQVEEKKDEQKIEGA